VRDAGPAGTAAGSLGVPVELYPDRFAVPAEPSPLLDDFDSELDRLRGREPDLLVPDADGEVVASVERVRNVAQSVCGVGRLE